MKSYINAIFFLVVINAAHGAEVEVVSELDTSKGNLKLFQKREKPTSFADYSIELNGKVIIKADSQSKRIVSFYPEKKPEYIVVQIITGGSGCPATYKVIDLTFKEPNVTELFGNCSDYIKTEYLSNRKIKLIVGGEAWLYSDGKFKEK